MNKVLNIAVCLTCHNRIQKTLVCLESLYKQVALKTGKYSILVFLCDDGSTDGTSIKVKEQFPAVKVIPADGSLFWARGMQVAFSEALKIKPDFFLMINDDVIFNENMLDIMFSSYFFAKQKEGQIAVVGSFKDLNGKWSYGGMVWNKGIYKDVKSISKPTVPYSYCDLANWNCFLIPYKLADKVGPIETIYSHAMADYDYSIRIKNIGGKIIVASNYIGVCSRNDVTGTWQDKKLPLFRRYQLLHKRSARPIKSYIHYCKVAYNKWWLYWFCIQYLWIAKTSIKYKIINIGK